MNREQWNDYAAHAPKPDMRYPWQNEQVERLRAKFVTDTDVVDGALRWKSNGSVIQPHTFKDADLIAPQVQIDASDAYQDEVLARYRANPPQLSPEDRAEALRELGPGAVDVITGRPI